MAHFLFGVYRVSLGFGTGFHLVSLDFTGMYWILNGIYWMVMGFPYI